MKPNFFHRDWWLSIFLLCSPKTKETRVNTLVEHCRIDEEKRVLDDLPENCLFDILIRLPVETLCSSRFVCKSWYDIISSPDFRNAHLHRSSDTTAARGLIFFTVDKKYKFKTFMVNIKSMEFKEGKRTIKESNTDFNGKIVVAACNGLIVFQKNPKIFSHCSGLILHNPVTREDEVFPLGTFSFTDKRILPRVEKIQIITLVYETGRQVKEARLRDYGHGEWIGGAVDVSRRYKLLRLFTNLWDELRKLGCEIMGVRSGSWRAVDVPPSKDSYLQNPIFAMGALHWLQRVNVGHGDDVECMVLVSMPLDDEKFKTMALPDAGGNYICYKSVFAMGEFLGFSGRLQRGRHKIGVWILRGLGGEYGWEKQYNINIPSRLGRNVQTLVCYGGGVNGYSFIFKCGGLDDGFLYAYDDGHLRRIEDIDGVADTSTRWILPHVNSLVTWRRS